MHAVPSQIALGSCGKHHCQTTGRPIGHTCGPSPYQPNPVESVRGIALRDANYHASPARKHNPVEDDDDVDVAPARQENARRRGGRRPEIFGEADASFLYRLALDIPSDRLLAVWETASQGVTPDADDVEGAAEDLRDEISKVKAAGLSPAQLQRYLPSYEHALALMGRVAGSRLENPVHEQFEIPALRDDGPESPRYSSSLHARSHHAPPRMQNPVAAAGDRPLHVFSSPGPVNEQVRSYVTPKARGFHVTLQDVDSGVFFPASYHLPTEKAAVEKALTLVGRSGAEAQVKHAHGATGRRGNPVETSDMEWRRKQIVLPEEIVARLAEVHGGQSTASYALMSTGNSDLVSLSMIDAAIAELDRPSRNGAPAKEAAETAGEMRDLRQFWKEHTAKEHGMLADRDPETFYSYDETSYGD